MLLGNYDINFDSKNRIIIPSKLRDSLGEQIVILKGLDECISIYSKDEFILFTEKLESLPNMESRHIKRFLFSFAQEAKPDTQGRVIIPIQLKDYAKIEKYGIIVGVGNHAEIWSIDNFKNIQDNTSEDMEKTLIKLGF